MQKLQIAEAALGTGMAPMGIATLLVSVPAATGPDRQSPPRDHAVEILRVYETYLRELDTAYGDEVERFRPEGAARFAEIVRAVRS
jgi:hypothetical protein